MLTIEEKIKKLPKWAQEHINQIERERENSVRSLNEYIDNQTESPFSVSDLLCEDKGVSFKKRYIQAYKMDVNHAGIHFQIITRDDELDISWGTNDNSMNEVAFIPTSFQKAKIKTKENMRW